MTRDQLHITFRALESSPALTSYVEDKARKLEHFHDRISKCSVAVELAHRHHVHGRRYRVRIDMHVPGSEIVAETPAGAAAEDAYASVDAAFDVAGRLLVEYQRRTHQRHRGAS